MCIQNNPSYAHPKPHPHPNPHKALSETYFICMKFSSIELLRVESFVYGMPYQSKVLNLLLNVLKFDNSLQCDFNIFSQYFSGGMLVWLFSFEICSWLCWILFNYRCVCGRVRVRSRSRSRERWMHFILWIIFPKWSDCIEFKMKIMLK